MLCYLYLSCESMYAIHYAIHSARLVLVVEEPDEDGEIVYQRRYVCNRDESMAEAGAEPNSKFIVELVYEDDEEDDE